MAVAVAFSATAAMATQPEYAQYFGTPSFVPPAVGVSTGPNSNPTVDALPGTTVYLPVFLRVLSGDNAPNPTINFTYNFGVAGVATGSGFTTGGGVHSGVSSVCSVVSGGDATHTAPAALGVGATELVDMGCNPAPSNNGLRSDGAAGGGVPQDQFGYYLGYIAVNVGLGASGSIDLYMHTQSGAHYTSANSAGSNNTVAYGWNSATNAPNVERAGSPMNDVIGTLNGQASTLPDATINVVPEPTTLGLLALGLVAARRRRS
jgi:hypothetical protein